MIDCGLLSLNLYIKKSSQGVRILKTCACACLMLTFKSEMLEYKHFVDERYDTSNDCIIIINARGKFSYSIIYSGNCT